MFKPLCLISIIGIAIAVPAETIFRRIIGGKDASIKEIPWQVSVQYYRITHCGGAIINDKTILTAAHCLDITDFELEPEAFVVRVGSDVRAVGGELYVTERAIQHPKFNSTNYHYDIALLFLEKQLKLSNTVQPISMPLQNEPVPVHSIGLVSGFGRIEWEGAYPRYLQEVYLPILSKNLCETIYYNINRIQPYMFCAGTMTGSKDACKGDSGGPLVVNGKVYGIVSFGVKCAVAEYPGVFTSVSYFRDWIDENLQ